VFARLERDWRSISKALQHDIAAFRRRQEKAAMAEFDALLNAPLPGGTPAGLKYKRCCGKGAPPKLGVIGNAA
jgi:hypothetical protein